MTKQIDSRTRVKLKFKLFAIGTVFCLQRKKWWGWMTVSWIYPSIVKRCGMAYTIEWLLWTEAEETGSDRSIGRKMMTLND